MVKVLIAISSVWPSGAAMATCWAPRLPLAPGLLSTTTGWPQRAASLGAMMRAMMSLPLLEVNGTTSVTGLPGNVTAGWAWTVGDATDRNAMAAAQKSRIDVIISVGLGIGFTGRCAACAS